MSLLALDARWRRLHDEARACPCCGRQFSGLIDFAFAQPDAWPHAEPTPGMPEIVAGEDRLSPDLCRIGEDRFLSALLSLNVRGSDEEVHFALWVAVAPKTFYAYLDAATGDGPAFEGGAGWLMNDLPGFESDEPLPCTLLPGAEGERPRIRLADGPLAALQADGIGFDPLLDLYAALGDDIRPHLAAD
ncbi:DUF2199 domain-containing protein [Shimia sp. FJ5]|uniref:DUF2199 domain-containing protein n=1 Tax=Shimia sp. FJ5 TaxID=3079054 RepID=UPI00261A778B|nr:DUF2199 domain-containing protein [Shimia sp. FJ5]MDV4143943.1 DUF2199 domain-containing protein [Shimia sp. FJ5]